MFRFNNLLILFTVIILFAFTSAPAIASPTVILDDKQLSFDVDPVVENGTTLVPLRAILEAMGATVTWDQNTQSAIATKDNNTVFLQLGSTSPTINGQVKIIDVPAKAISGTILAPLRFVGEAFGGNVQWNEDTQLITILSGSSSGSTTTAQQVMAHFIDVGQADSIYIQLPNHNDILIDGGNEIDGPTVVNYLKAQGVDDIELIIATHPDEDHIGGLPAVIEAFKVDKIVDSGKIGYSKTYNTFAADAKAEGCTWEADNRQSFIFGNVAFEILTGTETWQKIDDYSVVTRLDCGNVEFLFDGDATASAEAALHGDISAQILKVGNHGSTSSSSPAFLSLVKPQIAIISVGRDNIYGYPAAEILSRLQAKRATLYRTDLNGNIVVSTDGNTYSVTTAKNAEAPAQTITSQ